MRTCSRPAKRWDLPHWSSGGTGPGRLVWSSNTYPRLWFVGKTTRRKRNVVYPTAHYANDQRREIGSEPEVKGEGILRL